MFVLSLFAAHAITPVDNAVTDMTPMSNNAYQFVSGSPMSPVDEASSKTRLRPSYLSASMQTILDALAAGGCNAGDVQGYTGGAYSPGGSGMLGDTNAAGNFEGTLNYGAKSMTGTIDGQGFGADFSSFNKHGNFVFRTDDGGFVAGKWVRVKGTRGVFMGMQGTCDVGGSAEAALGDWYRGDVTGLDPAAPAPALFTPDPPIDGVALTVNDIPGITYANTVTGDVVDELSTGSRTLLPGEIVFMCPTTGNLVSNVTVPNTTILMQGGNMLQTVEVAELTVVAAISSGIFNSVAMTVHRDSTSTTAFGSTTTHPSIDYTTLPFYCPM